MDTLNIKLQENFRLMIMNPKFPKDKTKAVGLTKEQFQIVAPYLIDTMNDSRKPKEQVIIDLLEAAGNPIVFGD